MSKIKLTKAQAALVPELQNTWTVFAGLTLEQQRVVRMWDGRLICLVDETWVCGYYVLAYMHRVYRIPANAEYEVIDEGPGYVDRVSLVDCVSIDDHYWFRDPYGRIQDMPEAPLVKGFLGYIWPDSDEPSSEWFRVGPDGVEYCKAVRFRKGGAS